jgi:hypothetical protein
MEQFSYSFKSLSAVPADNAFCVRHTKPKASVDNDIFVHRQYIVSCALKPLTPFFLISPAILTTMRYDIFAAFLIHSFTHILADIHFMIKINNFFFLLLF